MDTIGNDKLLEAFLYESLQLAEDLEEALLDAEKSGDISPYVDQIFRIMHTIKGSSAMMFYEDIATLSHRVEDLFDYVRNQDELHLNLSELIDMVFESLDYIKNRLEAIQNGQDEGGDSKALATRVSGFLAQIKEQEEGTYKQMQEKHIGYGCIEDVDFNRKSLFFVKLNYQEDVVMKSVRAFSIVHQLKEMTECLLFYPDDIESENASDERIEKEGFSLCFVTDIEPDEIYHFFDTIAFLENKKVENLKEEQFRDCYQKMISHIMGTDVKEAVEKKALEINKEEKNKLESSKNKDNQDKGNQIKKKQTIAKEEIQTKNAPKKSNVISVNVDKLDHLMDIVGELMISGAMITENPELKTLQIESFSKNSRQLIKNLNDLQDIVMSVRMVPLETVFKKMQRIVRDVSKNMNKQTALVLIGENTEVDKNIIEKIQDPLMHLVRNSVDHGIELPEIRRQNGKSETGTVTLEAKNTGGEILVIVKDDGMGIDSDVIYNKAVEKGLTSQAKDELTDESIYNFIFAPGFSTKKEVSQYSGRGVGMDVVSKNISEIGGSVKVESELGKGSKFVIKIPLTLTIINGMNVGVGNSIYTIPIGDIRESFRVYEKDIISDLENGEMLMIRNECYPIVKLGNRFNLENAVQKWEEGIMVMVEKENKKVCLFVDKLIGEYQVVVKPLPNYLEHVEGMSGCALLGDGNISLILDVDHIANNYKRGFEDE